jgi:hypothetical protein
VHLHSIEGIGAQIADVCRDEDVPYVVTLHDAWWICGRQFMITGENRFCNQRKIDVNICATCVDNPTLNGYRQVRLHEILEGAALLLVPSEYFRQLFIENGFDPARLRSTRTVSWHQPVNDARGGKQADATVGYVGGETPIKGAHLLRPFKRLPHTTIGYVVDNVVNLGRRSIDPSDWAVR